MSQVTYRGVKYDTAKRPNQTFKIEPHVEIYRGTMFYVDENGNKLSMQRAGEQKWKNLTSFNSLKNKSKKKSAAIKHPSAAQVTVL